MRYVLDNCEQCLRTKEIYVRCASYVDAYRTLARDLGEGSSFDNAVSAWIDRNGFDEEEIAFNTLRNNVLKMCKDWDNDRLTLK